MIILLMMNFHYMNEKKLISLNIVERVDHKGGHQKVYQEKIFLEKGQTI